MSAHSRTHNPATPALRWEPSGPVFQEPQVVRLMRKTSPLTRRAPSPQMPPPAPLTTQGCHLFIPLPVFRVLGGTCGEVSQAWLLSGRKTDLSGSSKASGAPPCSPCSPVISAHLRLHSRAPVAGPTTGYPHSGCLRSGGGGWWGREYTASRRTPCCRVHQATGVLKPRLGVSRRADRGFLGQATDRAAADQLLRELGERGKETGFQAEMAQVGEQHAGH